MTQKLIRDVYLQNSTGGLEIDEADIERAVMLHVSGGGRLNAHEEPMSIPTLDYRGQAAFVPLVNQSPSRDGPEQPLLIPRLEFGAV